MWATCHCWSLRLLVSYRDLYWKRQLTCPVCMFFPHREALLHSLGLRERCLWRTQCKNIFPLFRTRYPWFSVIVWVVACGVRRLCVLMSWFHQSQNSKQSCFFALLLNYWVFHLLIWSLTGNRQWINHNLILSSVIVVKAAPNLLGHVQSEMGVPFFKNTGKKSCKRY